MASTDSQKQPSDASPPAYWYQPADEDEIDLFELWDIIWQGKWIIALITSIAAVASVAYALLATEIYEARVVMVAADSEGGGGLSALAGQFGGLAALAGVDLGGGGGSQTGEALQVLESFAFNSRFIQEQKLRAVLFEEKADDAKEPSLQDAVRTFASLRTVAEDKKSGAVTLTIQWTDPVMAAQWANALVERVNRVMREQDVAEAQRSIAFLKEKLDETRVVEMRDTLYRLIEAQTKTVMLANVRDQYVFKVIDPAYPPELRSKPKRALICVLGTMLGGFMGVLVVFGRRVVASYRNRESSPAA